MDPSKIYQESSDLVASNFCLCDLDGGKTRAPLKSEHVAAINKELIGISISNVRLAQGAASS